MVENPPSSEEILKKYRADQQAMERAEKAAMSMEEKISLIEENLSSIDSRIRFLEEIARDINLNIGKATGKLHFIIGGLFGIAITLWWKS